MKKYITLSLITLFSIGIFFNGCKIFNKSNEEKEEVVDIVTELGTIKVKLFNETPLHRDNFMKMVENGSMNGSIFHRVIKEFMIQGGSKPGSNGTVSMGETIPAEFNPKFHHKKGALCAARLGDQANPQKMSSGSQFYIVHGRIIPEVSMKQMAQRSKIVYTEQQYKDYATIGGTPNLDGQYTVFGEVISGLDIVDSIASVAVVGTNPVKKITITLKASK